MRRVVAATAASVLVAGLVSAAPAYAGGRHDAQKGKDRHAKGVDTSKLTKAVQVNGTLKHLRQLQTIANRNGGNRASGLPGYDASSAYVAKTLRAAGYTVRKQEFSFPFFAENEPATLEQLAPTAKDLETAVFTYSDSGSVSGPVVPTKDVVIPATATPSSTSGCEASDFEAAPSEPSIALVQRGTCDFGVKARNAKAAGYDAVIIFNEGNPDRTDLSVGTLGEPAGLPVVGLSYEDGKALVEAARDGGAKAEVTTDTTIDLDRKTHNLIADWPSRKTKNPDQVLVVGAHLDSVAEGPGINDNGTGTAATLEIAKQLARTGYTKKLQRPVRFAFWGAEELGLVGSQHYVDSLSDSARSKIYANLNFDMLGSPNYVRLVYDGDGSSLGTKGPAGSGQIEKIFTSYFAKKKLATDPTEFDGRSDYGPFIEYGIPAGGLFSGADDVKTERQAKIYGGTAGETLDQNYHTPADDITNLNTTVLGQLSDGAAHAIATIALSKKGLYGDAQRTVKSKQAAKKSAKAKSHLGKQPLR